MNEGDSCKVCSLCGFYSPLFLLGYTKRRHLPVYVCARCDGIDPKGR